MKSFTEKRMGQENGPSCSTIVFSERSSPELLSLGPDLVTTIERQVGGAGNQRFGKALANFKNDGISQVDVRKFQSLCLVCLLSRFTLTVEVQFMANLKALLFSYVEENDFPLAHGQLTDIVRDDVTLNDRVGENTGDPVGNLLVGAQFGATFDLTGGRDNFGDRNRWCHLFNFQGSQLNGLKTDGVFLELVAELLLPCRVEHSWAHGD